MDRKEINNLKILLSDYLVTKHNVKNLRKPFNCLNPNHEDRHPSMSYSSKYNICKCFSCGVSYDIFDLIGLDYGVISFKDKIQIIKELYPNVDIDSNRYFDYYEDNIKVIDFTEYFNNCKNNINKTNYLSKRNIDERLIKKYNIGYDEKRKMVVFPITKNCYFARSVEGDSKIKSKGRSYLWNEKYLNNSDNKLIYVTESIIDSLSLEMLNPNVKTIALNGLANYKRLLEVIKETNYNGCLILAFDNDYPGKMYQSIVNEELTNINVSSFCNTLIDSISDCKDINEALIKDKEQLAINFNYFNDNYEKILNEKEVKIESENER